MHFRKQCQKDFYLLHPPEKIIIDCKGGIYDIQAITIALHLAKKYDKQIIGITCVAGGEGVENAALDALYACKIAKVSVPIYLGSRQTFLLKKQRKTQIFGQEDNKELLQKFRSTITEEDKKIIRTKTAQAIKFLVKSQKDYRQKLGIICLGPLTNIALAYHLEYTFGKSGMVSIAGGQYTGIGNVIGQYSSEKNFQFDPHAAHIVIDNFNHNVFLSTIQTAVEFEEFEKICKKLNAHFNENPQSAYKDVFFSHSKKSFGWQEILATFPPFVRRSAIKQFIVYAEISLQTSHIEGFVAIDWVRMKPQFQQKPNTKIYSQFDNQLICQQIQSMILNKSLIGPKQLIRRCPKAQLHLHLEGTLQPGLLLKLAEKNKIPIKYKTLNQVKKAYKFENLKTFLQLYVLGSTVLVTEDDFFQVAWEYIVKANTDNVKHVCIFFDAQTHVARGIKFETILNGIQKATNKGKEDFHMSFELVLCFIRDRTQQQALQILKIAANYKEKIVGVGLASAEHGNPPSKFKQAFQEARKLGFRIVCHAGQQGPTNYIHQALEIAKAQRIGHGLRCLQDQQLVKILIQKQIPLTVCPLANVKLCQTKDLQFHPIKKMFDRGLKVTINSDDPSYFGGYINQNFLKVYEKFDFTVKQLAQMMINSFQASFLSQQQKNKHIQEIKDMIK